MYWGRDTLFRAEHRGYKCCDEQSYKQGLTIWQIITVHSTSAFLSQRTRWEYNRYQTTTRQPSEETAHYSKRARWKGADQASRGRQNHKALATPLILPVAGYLFDKNQWLFPMTFSKKSPFLELGLISFYQNQIQAWCNLTSQISVLCLKSVHCIANSKQLWIVHHKYHSEKVITK